MIPAKVCSVMSSSKLILTSLKGCGLMPNNASIQLCEVLQSNLVLVELTPL